MDNVVGGGGGGSNPPPSPPLGNPWVAARYGPIILPQNLHDMPNNYLKILPKFNGENETYAEDNIDAFQYCTNNLGVEYEDVYMCNFV